VSAIAGIGSTNAYTGYARGYLYLLLADAFKNW
jgi:hypothetical protein